MWNRFLHPFRKVGRIAVAAAKAWIEDDAFKLAAALAYYTIFSVGPLLLVATSVAGIFFGEEAARGELFQRLNVLMGETAAHAIEGLLSQTASLAKNRANTIIGIGVLLVGATTAFFELRRDLNFIWKVKPNPKVGRQLLSRLLSFGMVVGLGCLLLVSLIISTIVSAMSVYLIRYEIVPPQIFSLLDGVGSYLLVALVITLIFRILPEKKIRWRDAALGAFVTSFLFTIGKFAMAIYLRNAALSSTYGASASVIIILLWTYYSTLILFFGAEVAKVLDQSSEPKSLQPATP